MACAILASGEAREMQDVGWECWWQREVWYSNVHVGWECKLMPPGSCTRS